MPPATESASPSVSKALLTPDDVARLAAEARLELTEGEQARMAEQLSPLLARAEQHLGEVDTAGVEPLPPGAPAVPEHMHDGTAQEPLSQEEALENAPQADADGFFRMPGAAR